MTTEIDAKLRQYLDTCVAQKASDLHLISNMRPHIRKDGVLYPLEGAENCTPEIVWRMAKSIMLPEQQTALSTMRDFDWSFSYGEVRFRVNGYIERGLPAFSLRFIPGTIPTLESLGVPPAVANLMNTNQGFMIVTGPTGHGKSTTIAALIDSINQKSAKHIVSIEDPIEYLFTPNRSIISQREVGIDTATFATGLRGALREDADMVFVGEMRDLETIQIALTSAETGRLVLTTLHTNSAGQTADRIVDIFPPEQQSQIRQQLANTLLGVISQRLLPKISGGLVLVTEIMIANPAIRNLIREGRTHQIPNAIQTSVSEGMVSLDQALADVVSRGIVTADDAIAWSTNPKNLQLILYG